MATYTEGHPRWHRTRVSTYWWLGNWPYLRFILRELSSVFIAWFVVVVMLQIRAVSHGPEAYKEFEEWLRTPILVALNAISFFFVLFHTITWFNLAPKAMVVRLRGKRVPDLTIAALNYAAWLMVSALVCWLVLGG
jgi:succinate dehydrogenase subunit C